MRKVRISSSSTNQISSPRPFEVTNVAQLASALYQDVMRRITPTDLAENIKCDNKWLFNRQGHGHKSLIASHTRVAIIRLSSCPYGTNPIIFEMALMVKKTIAKMPIVKQLIRISWRRSVIGQSHARDVLFLKSSYCVSHWYWGHQTQFDEAYPRSRWNYSRVWRILLHYDKVTYIGIGRPLGCLEKLLCRSSSWNMSSTLVSFRLIQSSQWYWPHTRMFRLKDRRRVCQAHEFGLNLQQVSSIMQTRIILDVRAS